MALATTDNLDIAAEGLPTAGIVVTTGATLNTGTLDFADLGLPDQWIYAVAAAAASTTQQQLMMLGCGV